MKHKMKNGEVVEINFYLKIHTDPIQIFSVEPSTCDAYGLMEIPRSFSSQIDVKRCTMTTGKVKVKLINKDLIVSKYFYEKMNSKTDNIYNKKCEIILIENNHEKSLFTGFFRSIDNDPFETYYQIEIADIKEKMKETLFTAQITDSAFTIEKPLDPSLSIATYTKDNETFKKITFSGHPIKFDKDLFFCVFGKEYIEFVDLETFNENLYSVYNVYFEFLKPLDNPGQFLEEQVYRLVNAYPVVQEDGKIALVSQKQPTYEELALTTLNEEDIISVNKNNNDFSQLLNNIRIDSLFDFQEENYRSIEYLPHSESFQKFKELLPKKPYIIKLQGLNNLSTTQRQSTLKTLTDNLYVRYAQYMKTIELDIFISKEIRLGDYVQINHSKLIDTTDVKRGLEYEIDTSKEFIIGQNDWQNYLGLEENDSLGYFDGTQIVKVDKLLGQDFFESLITHHSKTENYLIYHERI